MDKAHAAQAWLTGVPMRRARSPLSALVSATCVVAGLSTAVCLAPPPRAARAADPVDPGVVAALKLLLDESGWEVHKLKAKGDVDVYKKAVPGQDGLMCFKGVKVVDVDSTTYFDAVIDIAHHVGLSKDIPLVESHVLKRSGNDIDFWQYLDVPGWTLANDRFWFAKARIMRDLGGVKGRHRQTWEKIDPNGYADAYAQAKAKDEDAVLTPINYGSWDVTPLEGGKTKVEYRVLSDPGGRLPTSAQNLATGTTLPDNILQFEAEAKRRAARGGTR
jgi:hypothetical protein